MYRSGFEGRNLPNPVRALVTVLKIVFASSGASPADRARTFTLAIVLTWTPKACVEIHGLAFRSFTVLQILARLICEASPGSGTCGRESYEAYV